MSSRCKVSNPTTDKKEKRGKEKKKVLKDDNAIARARRLRLAARREVRENGYCCVQKENVALSRRIETTLTRPADVGCHGAISKEICKRRQRARFKQRSSIAQAITKENSRLLSRLQSARSEYVETRQQLQLQSQQPKKMTKRLPDNLVKRKEKTLPPRPTQKKHHLGTNQLKVRQLALQRQEIGMYVQPKAELCIFKQGCKLGGRNVIVSVYENTMNESDSESPISINVYEPSTSTTRTLRVTGMEVVAALGPEQAPELMQSTRRIELCRALIAQLRGFQLNGQTEVIMTTHLSFGSGRESALLAEKRRLAAKLGRVPIGGTKVLPRDQRFILCQSKEIQNTVRTLGAIANANGQPFPDYNIDRGPSKVITAAKNLHSSYLNKDTVFYDADDAKPIASEHAKPCAPKHAKCASKHACVNNAHVNPHADILTIEQTTNTCEIVELVNGLVCKLEVSPAGISVLVQDEQDWVDCTYIFSPWDQCALAQLITSVDNQNTANILQHYVEEKISYFFS